MKTLRQMGFALPLFLAIALHSPASEAKLVEIWGSGLTGYGWGQGNGDNDFYRWVRGGAVGFEVGAKVLFIGAFVDYLRWFGGEAGANLITFNLGGDWEIGLTDSFSLVIRGAGGYYHGTLPSDASMDVDGVKVTQINTRGVGFRAGIGPRFTFWKVFSVGVTPEIGYHYFFGGAEESIANTDNNSSGLDFNVLAYFRVGLGF